MNDWICPECEEPDGGHYDWCSKVTGPRVTHNTVAVVL